jgi:hypothetical protein
MFPEIDDGYRLCHAVTADGGELRVTAVSEQEVIHAQRRLEAQRLAEEEEKVGWTGC